MFVLSPENSFNWFWAILLIWVVLLYPKALINWEESRVRSLYIRSLTKHCWFNSFPHQKSGKDLITFSTYRQQLSSERTSKVVFYKKVSMGKFLAISGNCLFLTWVLDVIMLEDMKQGTFHWGSQTCVIFILMHFFLLIGIVNGASDFLLLNVFVAYWFQKKRKEKRK